MGTIKFHKNVQLSGFNLGTDNTVSYPTNQTIPSQIDDATDNSIVYSFVNNSMINNNNMYAIYQPTSLSRGRYVIYRLGIDDKIKTYIGTISDVTDGFWDYNISSGEKYRYIVETSPDDSTDNQNSNTFVSLETETYINPKWAYWSICDIEKQETEDGSMLYVPSDTVFIMKNNLAPGTISDNLSVISYNTLGKYGVTIQNSQKYDSGSMSCLIGDFMAIQQLQSGKRIYKDNNVNNDASFKQFFENINNTSFVDYAEDMYFIFPNYSSEYYECVKNPVQDYIKLEADQYGIGEPIDWQDKYYTYYYEVDGHKIQIDKYQLVENVKPEINGNINVWNSFKLQHDIYYKNEESQYILLSEKPEIWKENTYYTLSAPIYDTNNKYYRSYLKMQYAGTSVRRVSNIQSDIELLKRWRDCVSNGKLKLLKAPNGQKWIVSVSDANTLDVAWHSSQYLPTIGFNWQEVVDINQASIIRWSQYVCTFCKYKSIGIS